MHALFKTRVSNSFLVLLFLLLAQSATAQQGRQLVKNKKRLVCQYRDGATAENAMTACQHHVKVHREGYTVVKAEIREDGQVMCTCQDPENKDAPNLEEASMVGEIICPPHSSEASTGRDFQWQESMCECDHNYVAQGDRCVPAKEALAAKKSNVKPAATKGKTATTPPAEARCACPAGANTTLSARLAQLPKVTPTFYPPTNRRPNSYQPVKIQDVGALLRAGKAMVVDTNAVHGLGQLIRQHTAARGSKRLLGTVSEQAAQLVLRTLPCDSVFEGKFNLSDNGFDILSFSPCVATPSAIRIVESKQVESDGNITLSAPGKGVQMSNEWELTTTHELSTAPPAVNRDGPRMASSITQHYTLVEKYVSAIYDGKLLILRLASF